MTASDALVIKKSLCVFLLRRRTSHVHRIEVAFYLQVILTYTSALDRAQWLHFQISRICWDREDAEGVGVAESTFPALHGDDGRARGDELQSKCVAQPKSNAVVHLWRLRLVSVAGLRIMELTSVCH